MERKRILNEAINNMYTREKRKAQQKEWDSILKGMGSAENRFAMAQTLLWHHLFNNWQPQMLENTIKLRRLMGRAPHKPWLTLIK